MDLDLMDDLWMSCFMKPKHHICVRKVVVDGAVPGPWLFPIASLPGTSALFWTLEEKMIGLETGTALSVCKNTKKVHTHVVTNLQHWEAVSIEFRCPEAQHTEMGLSFDIVRVNGLKSLADLFLGWGGVGPYNIINSVVCWKKVYNSCTPQKRFVNVYIVSLFGQLEHELHKTSTQSIFVSIYR